MYVLSFSSCYHIYILQSRACVYFIYCCCCWPCKLSSHLSPHPAALTSPTQPFAFVIHFRACVRPFMAKWTIFIISTLPPPLLFRRFAHRRSPSSSGSSIIRSLTHAGGFTVQLHLYFVFCSVYREEPRVAPACVQTNVPRNSIPCSFFLPRLVPFDTFLIV